MTQEAGAFQYRDRDPPPSWNGEKPESTLKPYLRDLQLWEAISDLPLTKRGPKLVQALSGPAREAARRLEIAELTKEDGVKPVTKALNDAFQPYQETALPRALESALYGQARAHKETIPEYILRFNVAQQVLKDEGIGAGLEAPDVAGR